MPDLRCPRDSDWCDGHTCTENGYDCPRSERALAHVPSRADPANAVVIHNRFSGEREHITDGECWCDPEIIDADPEIDRMNREVLSALASEIKRQDIKHGHFEGTHLGRSRLALACLRDEVDEAERAWRDERKAATWDHTRHEVLQVAAVAIRALRDAL